MRNLSLAIGLAACVATIPGSVLATTACNSSTACGVYENTYSAASTGGVAIHGEANSGIGIRGTSVTNTGFYGASASDNPLTPGVEGESTSTNHDVDAAAAFGLAGYASPSAAPAYGVLGYGNVYGLYGYTTATGESSTTGYGVYGVDATRTGHENVAVEGNSYQGIGVFAESFLNPMIAFNEKQNADVYLANTYYYLLGTGASGTATISYAGDETLSGTLTTSKSTYSATRGASGAVRTAYGARTTTPELQDVGEAQLIDGHASVPLDPSFSDSIDMRRPYHVFVTPDGDANLYVAARTPSGFVVRETHGGRSTIVFEYRIVAKPLDEDDGRLPAYHPVDAGRELHPRSGSRPATVASPGDALRQKLGNAGYAKALADLRARLAGR